MPSNSKHNRAFNQRVLHAESRKPRAFTPTQITHILQDPNTRVYERPDLVAMGQQLMVNPDDRSMMSLFMEGVEQLRAAATTSGDPFWANYPPLGTPLLSPGDIPWLRLPRGDELGMVPRVGGNVLVPGPTGSGKTTVIQRLVSGIVESGVTVICMDRKREHRDLFNNLAIQHQVTVLKMQDLRLSLYQPIAGVPREVVESATTDLIGRATGRMFAQRILSEAVEWLLLNRPGKDRGYTPDELIHAFQFLHKRGFRDSELKESMQQGLRYTRSHLGGVFNYSKSNLLDMMMATPGLYVIELGSLPADLYGLLIVFMMQSIYLSRLHRPDEQHPPVVFLLDDVTAAVDKTIDRQTVGGTSPLAEQVFMGRGLNMGLILAVHAPSMVSEKILRNCRNVVLVSGQGEEPRFLQSLMGLTHEQAEFAKTLQPGQAIALIPSKWPKPLLCQFDELKLPPASTTDCEDSARRFLVRVTSHRPPKAPPGPGRTKTTPGSAVAPTPSVISTPITTSTSRSQTALDPADLQALLILAEPLPPILTNWYGRLGLNRREGGKLKKRFEKQALIQLHRFPTGKRGGPLTVPELLPAAWQYLQDSAGKSPPKSLTRGGFEHNLAAQALKLLGQKNKAKVDFEVSFGAVRIDASWRYPSGKLHYYQIGISDPDREADAIMRAMAVPAVKGAKLVLVTRDRAFADKAKAALKQLSGHSPLPKLETRLIGELLTAVY